MELSYVGMRHRAVAIVFWTATISGAVSILLPFTTEIPTQTAVILLLAAVLFALWVQWKNGRGGFGVVRGLRPTFETRATLSASQWLLLLVLMLSETAVLALVLAA